MHGNARLTPVGRLTMVMRIESGRPVAHVAAEMGISRPTAYKWWRRWQVDGMPSQTSIPRSRCALPSGSWPDAQPTLTDEGCRSRPKASEIRLIGACDS